MEGIRGILSPVAHNLISETYELRQPLPNGSIPWSPKELQRLMNSYGKVNPESLKLLFPDRTHASLKMKASRLQIPRPYKFYTIQEDQRIQDLLEDGLTFKQMVPYFKNRTESSIKSRYYRLREKLFLNNHKTKSAFCTSIY